MKRALIFVAFLALAPGCAAWHDYNGETLEARTDFQAGKAQAAIELLAPKTDNELDGLCFTLERGVIAQAAGITQQSMRDFEKAETKVQGYEDRGLDPQSAAEYLGSIFVNDKTIPYQGESFERILIPVYNCRNYLLEGKLEDAMVEVRKIWTQQDIAKQLNQKELDNSKAAAEEKKVDTQQLPGVEAQVVYPKEALACPESIYEITYAHYLSALVSEATGHPDDARISLEAVAKIRPDLNFVKEGLERIKNPQPGEGAVALLFDCGWAPHKEEIKVVFPTYHTIGAVAIPVYRTTPNPAARARLVVGDKSFETALLSDVESIAFKYHKNRLPVIVLRQCIRAAAKVAAGEATAYGVEQAVKGGRQDRPGAGLAGWAAGLAVGVYNAVSEQADLRAWLSLPQSFQAVRASLPPGEYPARVELLSGGGGVLASADLGNVKVAAGGLSFVLARSVGGTLYATKR